MNLLFLNVFLVDQFEIVESFRRELTFVQVKVFDRFPKIFVNNGLSEGLLSWRFSPLRRPKDWEFRALIPSKNFLTNRISEFRWRHWLSWNLCFSGCLSYVRPFREHTLNVKKAFPRKNILIRLNKSLKSFILIFNESFHKDYFRLTCSVSLLPRDFITWWFA